MAMILTGQMGVRKFRDSNSDRIASRWNSLQTLERPDSGKRSSIRCSSRAMVARIGSERNSVYRSDFSGPRPNGNSHSLKVMRVLVCGEHRGSRVGGVVESQLADVHLHVAGKGQPMYQFHQICL